jgi:hypothetical protein
MEGPSLYTIVLEDGKQVEALYALEDVPKYFKKAS